MRTFPFFFFKASDLFAPALLTVKPEANYIVAVCVRFTQST